MIFFQAGCFRLQLISCQIKRINLIEDETINKQRFGQVESAEKTLVTDSYGEADE